MSLYDGFFDARLDPVTGKYDKTYGAEAFTSYFGEITGSGICISGNASSFLVFKSGQSAVVSPGYLFIRGYWLKNDADYTLSLPGTACAVAARLNTANKHIELTVLDQAASYPDALVLALVDASGALTDTRYDPDLCGVIGASGDISTKVEYALHYIDTEVEVKLAEADAEISAQSTLLDLKIAEVQAQVERIQPPPIGSIQFRASEDVGPEWLHCDGSFISETDYPELVAALGKLIPSGDKFQLLSDNEIRPRISNGALCNGRFWVYSYTDGKLYGIDTGGTSPIKSIALSGDENFSNFVSPTNNKNMIALSIVPRKLQNGSYKIVLAQMTGDLSLKTSGTEWDFSKNLLYWSDFSGDEESLTMTTPLGTTFTIETDIYNFFSDTIPPSNALPYVISRISGGKEIFYCLTHTTGDSVSNSSVTATSATIAWSEEQDAVTIYAFQVGTLGSQASYMENRTLLFGYNKKNEDECVIPNFYMTRANPNDYRCKTGMYSREDGTFDRALSTDQDIKSPVFDAQITNTVIAGPNKVIVQIASKANKMFTLDMHSLSNMKEISIGISGLPNAARVFPDAAAYLWGKDIYMIFVGTGILFSRTLSAGDWGYLDTTSVLGTITQFGYLDYSTDEGTLYLLGQDTTNRVKAAKIVLNTLYDYANDGAWLPMIASDGVPAYIKAKEAEE